MGDYSDAFFPDSPSLLRKSNVFALSDGTTQGMLNHEWAEILVKSFSDSCKSCSDIEEALLKMIDKSTQQWDTMRHQYVANKNSVLDENEYRWLFEYGSHATFLGLRFDSDCWEAVAIGDTCLFVLDKKESPLLFPIEKASNFTDAPKLISSLAEKNADIGRRTKYVKKKLAKGNIFYLMTDALAHWFLSEYEIGKKPWNQIEDGIDETDNLAPNKRKVKIRPPQPDFRSWRWPFKRRVRRPAENATSPKNSFEGWVGKLRASAEVVNDDITLMILRH